MSDQAGHPFKEKGQELEINKRKHKKYLLFQVCQLLPLKWEGRPP